MEAVDKAVIFSAGPSGYCICPCCGEKAAHQQGTACFDQQCPTCGTSMTREQVPLCLLISNLGFVQKFFANWDERAYLTRGDDR